MDWKGNRHVPMIPPIQIDLADPLCHDNVWLLLRDPGLKRVHLSPPCLPSSQDQAQDQRPHPYDGAQVGNRAPWDVRSAAGTVQDQD